MGGSPEFMLLVFFDHGPGLQIEKGIEMASLDPKPLRCGLARARDTPRDMIKFMYI